MDEFSCRFRTSLTSSWEHVSIVESLQFLGYKELLGWPAAQHHIYINSTVAKLRTLLKKVPRVLQCCVAKAETRAFYASQLHGWRRQGCLSSLVGICNLAQLGLVSVRFDSCSRGRLSVPNCAEHFSLVGRQLYVS
eukprot:5230529-Amphidinium_carterae.1